MNVKEILAGLDEMIVKYEQSIKCLKQAKVDIVGVITPISTIGINTVTGVDSVAQVQPVVLTVADAIERVLRERQVTNQGGATVAEMWPLVNRLYRFQVSCDANGKQSIYTTLSENPHRFTSHPDYRSGSRIGTKRWELVTTRANTGGFGTLTGFRTKKKKATKPIFGARR